MNNQIDINTYLGLLKNQECWSIIAGPATGSVVSLGFGEKIPRNKPDNAPYFSADENMFDAGISLLIYCSWRLSKCEEVICSWISPNKRNGEMLKSLALLRNKKILNINISQIVYDLDIYFEDDLCLQLFCDATNNKYNENYIFFIENAAYTVGMNGHLEAEYY